MDSFSHLITPGSKTELLTNDLSGFPEPLHSFLEEQKEQPAELKMIGQDILELANQVGEVMEVQEISEDNLDGHLSFLNAAESSQGTEGIDPTSSLFISDSKIEVENVDFGFLDDQNLSESEDEDDSESGSDDEVEDEEESNNELDNDEMASGRSDKKNDEGEDDGVFGQVSFYDEEPSSDVSLNNKKKLNQGTVGTVKRKKGKKEKKVTTKRKKHKKKRVASTDDNNDSLAAAGLMRRKNIRSILKEKDMDKDMLSAQNEELERQKRLMDLKKSLLQAAAASSSVPVLSASAATVTPRTTSVATVTSKTAEKDSQLKSLLQVAEEEAQKEAERKLLDKEVVHTRVKPKSETSPPSDVITLSSDSSESDGFYDDEESEDVVMVASDEEDDDDDDEEDDAEDVNNGGSHINDTLNMPDADGKVKVNIGHPLQDPDIYLAPQIAQSIKPHQIGGVRFLYDNLVESLDRLRTTPGFGCILAHSMGLGKTIQLISFIDIFLRCAGGKRVLCIVPINTLQNWLAEFNYWLPAPEKLHPEDHLTQSRSFPLYIINDSMKTMAARAAVIEKWKDNGGVLVMGYEMFRLLSSKTLTLNKSKSRSRKVKPEVIDVEEEDKNKKLLIDMYSTLVNPGPDLVMCDEGHRIKNSGAAISQALKNIKTRRRVVLTGYPLQNNLLEYWCMVDFVRPNFLGNKGEFSNMFERPIMNGQCMDSTPSDKKVMRHRSYVLHNLLEGFVQRRGHTVLQLSLPPKLEHVLLVRLSPIQRKIYCEFMKSMTESGLYSWAHNNPLKAFAVCCKVWNHPDILHEVVTKRITDKDNDLDIETGEGPASKKKTPSKTSTNSAASTDSLASISPSASTASLTSLASEGGLDKNPITYDWAEPLMKHYNPGMLEYSGKFILMMALIEECLAVGDKILIFSQSLLTLNKIEEFLSKFKVPRPDIDENWHRNKTYFRLDGSTSAQEREKLINLFNDPDSKAWAFLLSTKAGCLGINLVSANRVIVVDASWNPCHDCQAICRVYRFGQIKRSYIYRLITDNTLEKKIYDRQINKQGMSDRIVDDMNPENKLTRRQVESLLDFEDIDFPVLDFSCVASRYNQDPVMLKVLQKHGYWLSKYPFNHESLLIDRKELRLSKREKRIAKEGYARAKQMNIAYSRPMYAAYRPPFMASPYGIPPNSRNSYAAFQQPGARPVASVRPMIASHSQSGADDIKEFNGQPLRPGVTIHQVITTTEIVLPGTNTGTQAGASAMNKIAAGQKILVIKTPKGVYIRTDEGKMFAVRSKAGTNFGQFEGINAAATTTSTTSTMSSAGGGKGINNIDSSIMSAMRGALSSSLMGKKSSSLADLIAADDSFGTDSAFGKKNIVLPPLGVRSARPLSHIPSSTRARPTVQATPVIITPNKPVVSMGTRKPARNVRSRQWKEAELESMRDLPSTDFSARKEGSTLTGMKSSTSTSLAVNRNPLAVPNFANHPLLSQGREPTPNNKQQTAANIPRAAYQARGQYQQRNQSLPSFPDLEDNLSGESTFKSQSSPLSLEHSLGSISARTTSSTTAGQRVTKKNQPVIGSNLKEDTTSMDSDLSEDGQESQSDARMRELWNLKPTGPKLGSFHDFGEDSNNSSRMGSFSDEKALPPYMMGFQQSERVSPSQSFQQGLPFSDPALPPSHGKRYGPMDTASHTVSSNVGTSLRAQDLISSIPFGGTEHERFDTSDLDMYVPTNASPLPVDTPLQGHFHHLPHSSSSSSILASALQRSGLQDLDASGSPSSGSQDTLGLDDSNRRGNLAMNNSSSFSRGMPSHYRDSFSASPADSNNSSSSDSTGFMAVSTGRSTSAWSGSLDGSNLTARGNPAGAAPRFLSANMRGKPSEVNNYPADDGEQHLGPLSYLPANNNPGVLAGRMSGHDSNLGGDLGQNLQQFSVSPFQSSQSSMMGLREPPPSYLSSASHTMKATRSSNSGAEPGMAGAYNYPYSHSNQLGFGPGDQGNLNFTSSQENFSWQQQQDKLL